MDAQVGGVLASVMIGLTMHSDGAAVVALARNGETRVRGDHSG
jgi:hypothetical protein